jgi:uncharacterized caspase-like protein
MKWPFSFPLIAAMPVLALPLAAANPFFEHSYAVVIGIDKYPAKPNLSYAVKDAQAMTGYLRGQGYEIVSLYDQQATKQNILAAMQNQLAPRLTNKDRVLVFFAGHGATEVLGGQDIGYIIPYDGGSQSASYISMDELNSQSAYMGNARHQLFIMDSCYGGLLAVTRSSFISNNRPDYVNELQKRITRQVMTAGGKNQEVLDGGPKGHSFFVDYLLEALQDGLADRNRNGYITFSDLSDYLLQRASSGQQTPVFASLRGNQGGEYLFDSPQSALAPAAPRPVTISGPTRGTVRTAAAEIPLPPPDDLPRAIELAEKGDCKQAVPSLQKGLILNPENAYAHYRLGLCVLSTDHRAAYDALTEAIKLDSSHAEYFMVRASAATMMGQQSVALRDLDQALKLDNRNLQAYLLRGDIFMKEGMYGDAANAYSYAYQLDHQSSVCALYAEAVSRNGNAALAQDIRRGCAK